MTAWIARGEVAGAAEGPLAGLRFAVKDNIDVAGFATTAADPRRTDPATAHAAVVERLLAAGADLVGKTNLDQYATGLVGTRSPYGACHAVGSAEHVSGGSSSGSGVVVARGEVDFALGTDTAGSGRVPAAFNGIVGIKPSRGLVSTRGVLPACRSLDCVTVFARDLATARRAYDVMAGFDPEDPFARRVPSEPVPVRPLVIGVPAAPLDLEPLHAEAWDRALAHAERIGTVVPVDVEALLEVAGMLYDGPWVAERWTSFGAALDDDPAVDAAVRRIVRPGADITAAAAFSAFERLAALARRTEQVWVGVDTLLLPVTREHPTLAEVAADPIGVNARLGRFTNMTNLLDLCAVAVPGPERADGLPFGVQLLAPAGHDDVVHAAAADWLGEPRPAAPPRAEVLLAVAGAHLRGEPLNHQLVERGARLVEATHAAGDYRMFAVPGPLPRPGLSRVGPRSPEPPVGRGPEVEVWALPAAELAGFAALVLPPLALGPMSLADGRQVLGFVCTADGVDQGTDITSYGGWRAYRAAVG
ncbi:allophanate hydrolase [Nocardioides ultimimeridianus]